MFQGENINELVNLLEERKAYLYHACQLMDFCSYLEVGGIPSRAHLESEGQYFTPFETDQSDRNRGVWDKVFANLWDFGSTFAKGGNAVPNTYGPILFQIKPKALSQGTDVAICLRSAGRQNFDRKKESLKSIEDVNRLFKYPVGDKNCQYVKKDRTELQEEFSERSSDISAPEISCTVDLGYLPLEYVKLVRVEPYRIQGKPLKTWVEEIKNAKNYQFRVFKRDRFPPYTQELIDILTQEMPSLSDLCQNHNLSQELRDWAKKINEGNLEYQFNRFAKYLRTGTILAHLPH